MSNIKSLPSAQYLPSAEFLEYPSANLICGSKLFKPCIAPRKRFLGAMFTSLCSVAPLTNVTAIDLNYQLYLNYIFHREWLSFLTHAVAMPFVNLFLLATAEFYLPSMDAAYWISLGLFVWYLCWGLISGVYWMGPCSIPILMFCYYGGHFYLAQVFSGEGPFEWYLDPLCGAALFSFIQSASHIVEDLPPRLTGSPMWTTKRDFFCQVTDHELGLGQRLIEFIQRLVLLTFGTLFFGPLDEMSASPRLLPLFWSIAPVYWLLRFFEISYPRLDRQYANFARSLAEQPRISVLPTEDTPAIVPHNPVRSTWPGSCADFFVDNFCQCLCPGDYLPGDGPCGECCCMGAYRWTKSIPNPALDFIGLGGGMYVEYDIPWWQILSCHIEKLRYRFLPVGTVLNLCTLPFQEIQIMV